MKVIQSAGGPLFVIDRDISHLWSANTGKTFIGSSSAFAHDYEALGYLSDGTRTPPRSVALFAGAVAQVLLITMPFETAIVHSTPTSICIAQVEYADADWSFSNVTKRDFDTTFFGETIKFHSRDATYLVFDSAYLVSEIGEEFLQFDLLKGEYLFSAGFCQPDKQTSLILYKIVPAS